MYEMDESEIDSKFYDLCRLCASYDNVKISLFGDEGKKRQLRKKIQSCLPFKVEENDELPKSLCYKCVYNLESTYEFRYKCIQINRSLEKHVYKKEKDKQLKHGNSAHRIRPEVSIFALPSNDACNNQNTTNECNSFTETDAASPNPLDFLEVGVNSDETIVNVRSKNNTSENKKQYMWNADRRWLSVEHKPLNTERQQNEIKKGIKYFDLTLDENNLNRRKNCNPRKIAREIDGESEKSENNPSSALNLSSQYSNSSSGTSIPTPGLIAISIAAPLSSSNLYVKVNSNTSGNSSREGKTNTMNSVQPSPISVIDGGKESNSQNETKSYSCLLCERICTTRSSLNQHIFSIHGIEPSEVVSQSLLVSHPLDDKNDEELAESMMEQETIIFCEVCRREFQDRASLWLHMVHAHREEASVSCGICLKICCDNITLIEHVNTAHSGDKAVIQRRYSCQVCGRQHDSRQKLLKHATLHTLIDNQGKTIHPEEMVSLNNAFAPRECPTCHRKFFNDEKLTQHMQNFHNDSNDFSSLSSSSSTVYKCELCTSAHATRIDRWWHMYHAHNGDPRVTCERKSCHKIFVSQTLKDEHSNTHHNAQGAFTNTCEICGKLWESRIVFYKHMMNVHPKCLPTVCGICLKIFSNVPELRLHVRSDHPPLEESGGICCDVCGRPYAERSKMLRHRRVHNVTDVVPAATSIAKKKDDLICNFCPDTSFTSLQEISDHRRSVHQLFVCDLCPKFYNGNNHLWKHVSKQHKGDPSVTCNLCLRTSASRSHLERHKLKYHSDPVEKLIDKPSSDAVSVTHKCSLCGKIFRIRSLLKKHLKSCKGIKPAPQPKPQPVNGIFPCVKCGKIFQLENLLGKHMKNSHVIHFCEICEDNSQPEGFDTKTALLHHIRVKHTNHPELYCDVPDCGKVLRLKADLKKHKLEHSRGYFTYICELCGDMFSNRKKVRKHLQTYHKNDVKFLCAMCNAIHPNVEELTNHVHTAHSLLLHRPCTCQICGKCYSVTNKVVDHIAKVHGSEYKPCRLCWKLFTDEAVYEDHVNNHPPIEEKPSLAARKMVESRIKPSSSKSNLSQELVALGINFSENENGKRSAEEELTSEENSKRLRHKYRCTLCKETFRTLPEFKEHGLQQHDNPEPPLFEEEESCNESMLEENEELKQERWTDIKPIACDCCQKIWNSKKQLWQHLIRSHPYQSMHTCGICLRVCKNYYDLFYHLDTSHSSIINDMASSRFACYICGHYHNSQSKLDKHFTLHKNTPLQYEYKCQYCQKIYKSVIFYREHLRVHEVKTENTSKSKEFSGFSIDRILDMNNTHEDEIEAAEVDDEDDEEEEQEDEEEEDTKPSINNNDTNDEDMVELEADSDTDNDCSSTKDLSGDDNVFKGYESNVYTNELPHSSKQKLTQHYSFEGNSPYRTKEDHTIAQNYAVSEKHYKLTENTEEKYERKSSSIENSRFDAAQRIENSGIINGEQYKSKYNVNNNQKQDKPTNYDEKLSYKSNGEENYRTLTD